MYIGYVSIVPDKDSSVFIYTFILNLVLVFKISRFIQYVNVMKGLQPKIHDIQL